MTFKEFEAMQERLITLNCAFQYYKMKKEENMFWILLNRLNQVFRTDDSIREECESFIASYSDLLEKFYQDTLE